MKKIKDLEQDKQDIGLIEVIVWMVIAVIFTANLVVSTFSILKVSNQLITAATIVIGISLINIAVFLKDINILKLMTLLSIVVLSLALIVGSFVDKKDEFVMLEINIEDQVSDSTAVSFAVV